MQVSPSFPIVRVSPESLLMARARLTIAPAVCVTGVESASDQDVPAFDWVSVGSRAALTVAATRP